MNIRKGDIVQDKRHPWLQGTVVGFKHHKASSYLGWNQVFFRSGLHWKDIERAFPEDLCVVRRRR